MREIARVIPKDTYIDTMDGTVSPTTTASGAGTGTANQPSIHIVGWVSTGHDHTARLMSALRLMDGVDDVTLAISAKGDNTAGAATGSAGPHDQWPKFDITVIYKAPGTSAGTSTTDLKSVSDAARHQRTFWSLGVVDVRSAPLRFFRASCRVNAG
jgi:hypothetical protein